MTARKFNALVYFAIVACIAILLGGSSTSVPHVNAQATLSDKSQTVGDIPSKGETVGTPSSGSQILVNPFEGKVNDIPDLLFKIIDVLLVFAIPLIVLYIMYAGYLFVTAAGNTEQISTAKNALLWAVVGGVVILGARLIFNIIKETIKPLL